MPFDYAIGDRVRIVSGNLQGLTGTVKDTFPRFNIVTLTLDKGGRVSQSAWKIRHE